MQTCPGFFLKFLLESPGNLLEICSVTFVDTLDQISCLSSTTQISQYHKRFIKETNTFLSLLLSLPFVKLMLFFLRTPLLAHSNNTVIKCKWY